MKRHITSFGKALFFVLFIVGVSALIGISFAQDNQEKLLDPIIISPSSVGEVAFPHQFHFEGLELECQTCHHEINASILQMPHEAYFDDFWIDCKICHRGDGSAVSQPQSCSNCHHNSPTDIADETLSAKVVIHKNCWKCHEMERGEKASQSCSVCHIKNPDKKTDSQTSFYLMEGSSR
ncbi:MAG: cytochrome c family protein [Candidatus Aminicenantes bacterium]|nr:cytochrome c family protein [Candidatus Aminicenantes bacterium]